jgi:sulfoxide reductase heme-binding subunit YedZ
VLGYRWRDGLLTVAAAVEPLEHITRGTGDWVLYLLCITLAVTPLRRFTGWNWLVRLRREIGLFAFFYACLHFLAFLWFDHFFDVADMAGRSAPFITVASSRSCC